MASWPVGRIMPKVYFACSIRGGGDTSSYLNIIKAIQAAGGEVISEVFVHDAIQFGGSPLPANEIYERDIAMINEADFIVAEVTNPSLGVGYELAYAEKINKPIACLFNDTSGRKLSAMILGNPYNLVINYSADKIPTDSLADFLAAK